jgi:hypothetical protein
VCHRAGILACYLDGPHDLSIYLVVDGCFNSLARSVNAAAMLGMHKRVVRPKLEQHAKPAKARFQIFN